MTTDDDQTVPVEIERKFLLDRCPQIPFGVCKLRLEQGYLSGETEGRIRRSVSDDGTITCTHTIKRGQGLVREEWQQEITPERFAALWPETAGARITKTRYKTDVGPVEWVVDVFDDVDLVLAEAEMPTVDTPCPYPDWIAGHIVREVTDDPKYTNAQIAQRLAAAERRE